jgi:hypothetical protein
VKKLALLLSLLFSTFCFSQQFSVSYSGSASVSGVVSGSVAGIAYTQATNHYLEYVVTGSPSSFSIQLEGSADNGTTYSICGSSSSTTNVTKLQCSGVYDHLRLNVTSLSGGTSPLVLWNIGSSVSLPVDANILGSPSFTLIGTPAVSISGTPTVAISGTVPVSGSVGITGSVSTTSATPVDPCTDPGQDKNSVAVNIGAATTLELISLTAGQRIYPCGYIVTAGAAGTFQLVTGTGTNCAVGQTPLTGAFTTLTGTPLPYIGGMMVLKVPVSQAVCGITTGLLSTSTGQITYIKK